MPLPTDNPFIKLSADALKFSPLSFVEPLDPNIFPLLPKIELLLLLDCPMDSIENVPIGKLLLLLLLLLELLVISRGAGDVGVNDPTCWLPKLEKRSRAEKSEKSKKDAETKESVSHQVRNCFGAQLLRMWKKPQHVRSQLINRILTVGAEGLRLAHGLAKLARFFSIALKPFDVSQKCEIFLTFFFRKRRLMPQKNKVFVLELCRSLNCRLTR